MVKIFTGNNPAFNLPVDTIYYIESARNAKLNDFVQNNKVAIEKLLAENTLLDYKLEYIGRNYWQNAQLQDLLQLQFPEKTQDEVTALQTTLLGDSGDVHQSFDMMKLICQRFASHEEQNSDDCFDDLNLMCRLVPTKGTNDQYSFLTMNLDAIDAEKLYEQIADFVHELDLKNEDAIQSYSEGPHIRMIPGLNLCISGPSKEVLRERAQKIRDEIAAMQRENGINILVEILGDDLLATLKKMQPTTLSRLVVDENMQIFLPDYQDKEVKMNALSKTLYCLFLLHPQGIRIKDLLEYKSELLAIYKLISNRADMDMLTKSIDELCDPMSNSINEKISRIRKAFCDVMVSDLAQAYIPSGPRGEAKLIGLDRKLVFLPQVLKNIAK